MVGVGVRAGRESGGIGVAMRTDREPRVCVQGPIWERVSGRAGAPGRGLDGVPILGRGPPPG